MFTRCELYVLKSFSRDCSSPMSMSILWNIPNLLDSSTGTGIPHWNIYCNKPAVCRQTDLPPALGPEIRIIRWSSFISISRGTTSFPLPLSLGIVGDALPCTIAWRGCLQREAQWHLPGWQRVLLPARNPRMP